MHAEEGVGGDDERTDVQRGALFRRHPVDVCTHQLDDGLQGVVGVDLRDAEAAVGVVHPLDVLVRTEEQRAPVGRAIRLESLEHLLRIMENHRGGGERKIVIRLDARVMPALSLGVVHNKHMVGEVFAEPELGGIGLCFGCGGFGYGYFHNRQRLLYAVLYSVDYNTKI